MGINEKILAYLSVHGKENNHRLASMLKVTGFELTKALSDLEKQGKIEIKSGLAFFVKGKKIVIEKLGKRKKQSEVEVKKEEPEETKEEIKEEAKPEEEQEQPQTELPEGVIEGKSEEVLEEPAEEAVQETAGVKTEEKGERIEGTVKFFNVNKGFGFITGDEGKEYYVHESALKEGVKIEANNRVSFKVVQGDKGPKAEEVEWISQA